MKGMQFDGGNPAWSLLGCIIRANRADRSGWRGATCRPGSPAAPRALPSGADDSAVGTGDYHYSAAHHSDSLEGAAVPRTAGRTWQLPLVRALVAGTGLTLIALPVDAATVSVGAGDSLQAAIDNASAGDTILVHAGATFVGNFVVRAGKRSITIRSSAADTNLPRPGQRTGPEYCAVPAEAAVAQYGRRAQHRTGRLLHHSRKHRVPAFEQWQLDRHRAWIRRLAPDLPRRCAAAHRARPDPVECTRGRSQKRGIALNSGDTTIKNSYLYGLKYDGADAQAICGWNGPGPFVLENNRLVASGENVLFGGSDPRIPYLVPSNIKVLRNHIDKPLSWKGSVWDVKNLFELKNAQDVLVEGNVFAYNWLAAQPGFSILFTPRNQNGTAPWSVVQRVVFRNNIVRHVSSVFKFLVATTKNRAS